MHRIHVIPRRQNYDKTLVEIYRPKKFVAESLTSVYASRTTVAPNGHIRTDAVKGIEDRHLKASPDLPSLQERSSKSNSKNLYNLSLQLMDKEEICESDCSGGRKRIRRQVKVQDPFQENVPNNVRTHMRSRVDKVKIRNPRHDRRRSPPVPAMDDSIKKDQKKNKEYSKKVIGPLNSKPYPPKTIRDQDTIQKTALNIQKAEVQPHVVESDMESFRYSENPKETLRAIFEKAALNIGTTKPASLVKKNLKDQKDPKDPKNEEDSKEILEKVNVDDILKAWVSQKIQFVLELIDANHTYSLIFFLVTVIYLVYILWYDVSCSVNEENRYQAKLQSSGLPMKSFYYLMRLLRAPIF
ncbi:uncharacterized protein LOC119550644 isoform X2 [Drosophila subpulchrella]|uniref:uncharacterized protein LOC119550644 isoform X2 n=1 Tax=Drosophila subpulchrella TaxID=1486046 RepID=UPI0018A17FB9|nr:uncharacterized protein LOC119550644 isoform X2 [Drosophila subpulchrella]